MQTLYPALPVWNTDSRYPQTSQSLERLAGDPFCKMPEVSIKKGLNMKFDQKQWNRYSLYAIAVITVISLFIMLGGN